MSEIISKEGIFYGDYKDFKAYTYNERIYVIAPSNLESFPWSIASIGTWTELDESYYGSINMTVMDIAVKYIEDALKNYNTPKDYGDMTWLKDYLDYIKNMVDKIAEKVDIT
jgi:hypothetical protein